MLRSGCSRTATGETIEPPAARLLRTGFVRPEPPWDRVLRLGGRAVDRLQAGVVSKLLKAVPAFVMLAGAGLAGTLLTTLRLLRRGLLRPVWLSIAVIIRGYQIVHL